jgi:hypothetical protein
MLQSKSRSRQHQNLDNLVAILGSGGRCRLKYSIILGSKQEYSANNIIPVARVPWSLGKRDGRSKGLGVWDLRSDKPSSDSMAAE